MTPPQTPSSTQSIISMDQLSNLGASSLGDQQTQEDDYQNF